MANLRDIRRRIVSIKKTRQITSAMKLVAGAKLRRAIESAEAARPYQEALVRVLGEVAQHATDLEDPLFQTHETIKNVEILVFSSDRGLCGGFNTRICRYADDVIWHGANEGRTVRVRSYGRKVRDFLGRRGATLVDPRIGLQSDEFGDMAREAASQCRTAFQDGEVDEVYLVYNRFVNTMTQRPSTIRLLPISLNDTAVNLKGAEAEEDRKEDAFGGDYLFEPDAARIMRSLLPIYLETVILQAFLENQAGEHAARMTAMENATRNASELIDNLTLVYNRARQAAITKELIEIVSGAEAL